MRALNRFISSLEVAVSVVAIISMALMMLIVTADVALRYIFKHPLPWVYDVVTLYLGVFLFYFALARTSREDAHVGVNILLYIMSDDVRRMCEIIKGLVGFALLGIICVVMLGRAQEEFVTDNIIAGYVDWLTWPASAAAALGSGLMALNLAVCALLHAASLISRRELIALPQVGASAD